MVRQDLVSYLKKELSAGYDISTLRNHLISQGYNKKEVDEAVDALYKQPKAKTLPKFPKIKLGPVAILIAAVILFVIGFFVLRSILAPEAPSNEVLTFEPEAEEPSAPVQSEETEQEPVVEEEQQQEPYQQYEITPPPAAPASGQVSVAIALEKIDTLSLAESMNLCSKYADRDEDRCLRKVALTHDDSSICDSISTVSIRDDCYINFAYIEDFTVCEKIQDVYLKQSCRDLGKLDTYQFEEQ
ncbi:hypothetical protein KY311_04425 [Candidatus Woesearchaeota archaeon]|nr:hypothetical protein [Candidatus Woesearchaeota archaeon]